MIKRYQATNHIMVLNLENAMSWRGYKNPLLWLEDFRTEGNKMGTLDNMHQLCVPKGKQLDHYVEETVRFLRNPPVEPFCYRCMMQSGYDLQKVYLGTEFPEERQERKRKSTGAGLRGTSANPIALEETEDPKPK